MTATFTGLLPRVSRAAIAVLVVLASSAAVLLAGPANSAGAAAGPVGYVRLAHLSPDTPEVDVYLSKYLDASFAPQRFDGVGYGVMSNYLALPAGSYVISMRLAGEPESTPPTLTTTADVAAGGAYTVAGVGMHAKLGLVVLTDDLSRPAAGKAKVRVIQASVASNILDVRLANGTTLASTVQFASTTPYQTVSPGTWTLKLSPSGSTTVTTVSANLGVGNVYSLLVLDSPNGLRAQLRADARGGNPPFGGVATGVGGTADEFTPTSDTFPVLMLGAGVLIVAALLTLAVRMRRLASRRS